MKITLTSANGVPQIVKNGQCADGNFFFLNGDTLSFSKEIYLHEIEISKANGFHRYSININLDFQKQPGLTVRDREILDTVFGADEAAEILLRVNTTQFLTPEDCTGVSEQDCIVMMGERQKLISISSPVWQAATRERLAAIAEDITKDPVYREGIIGYHLEWLEWMQPRFYECIDTSTVHAEAFRHFLENRYKNDEALSAAWGKSMTLSNAELPADIPMDDASHNFFCSQADCRYIDYLDFMGELTAGIIEDFAKTLKAACDGECLVLSFYGYFFEIYHASAGHFALQKLLNSEYLDGFVSPDSYIDRNAGKDVTVSCSGFMTTVDTVIRHGKLWISESDQRTFLNRLPHPQDEVSYPPLPDVDAVIQTHLRAIGQAMVHGSLIYPMELTGCGWYDDPYLFAAFAERNRDLVAYRSLKKTKPTFQVGLVVDERANAVTGCSRMSAQSLSMNLQHFYRTGVSFALVEMQDVLSGAAEDISFLIFPDCYRLNHADVLQLCERLHQRGKTALFLNGFGTIAPADVKLLTGMNFVCNKAVKDRSIKTESPFIAEESFEMANGWTVTDAVEVLGRYADGTPAFFRKAQNNFTAVFCGTPSISAKNLSILIAQSGIPVLGNCGEVLVANDDLIVCQAGSAGLHRICFDEATDVYDDVTGVWMKQTAEVTFTSAKKGEVHWIFYGEMAQKWKNYREQSQRNHKNS